MTPQHVAECALAALKASQRDAQWLADAMLNAARPEVLDHYRYHVAMDLTARAAGLRDALAERIAMLEPVVAAIVADLKYDGEPYACHH